MLRSSSLIAGFLCVVGGLQQAGEPRASFRAAIHLHTVAVTATSSSGSPVGDLRADEFELWLDGEPQDISFVLAPAEVPLEIAILIDTSESIRSNVPGLGADLRFFLESLDTADCVFVLPFGDSVGPGSWNVDTASFIDDLRFRGNTKLNDAIVAALDMLSPGTEDRLDPVPARSDGCGSPEGIQGRRRRAAVLITDGHDQGSYASPGEVLLRAWSARVPFVVLGVGEAAAARRTSGPARVSTADRFAAQLEALVRTTGGRFIRARRGEQRERIFDDALDTLRSTYVLASALREPPTNVVPRWHTIEVRTRREGVTLAAPAGVYSSAARRADAAAYTLDGRRDLDRGALPSALDLLSRAVDADGEFWQPHFFRAIAAIEARQPNEAVGSARRAVYLRPLSPDAHALFADALLQRGEADLAAKSALAAAHLGLDIAGAAAVLEGTYGIDLNLEAQSGVPRLWIVADEHADLPLQQHAARIARLLTYHLAADPGVAVVSRPVSIDATYGIHVRLNDAREGTLTISSVMDEQGALRAAGHTGSFALSTAESDSLVGPDPPDVPAALVNAFTVIWQRRNQAR